MDDDQTGVRELQSLQSLERERNQAVAALRTQIRAADELRASLEAAETDAAAVERRLSVSKMEVSKMEMETAQLKRQMQTMMARMRAVERREIMAAEHHAAFAAMPTIALLMHGLDRDVRRLGRGLRAAPASGLSQAAAFFVLLVRRIDGGVRDRLTPTKWRRDPKMWKRTGLPGIKGADFQ